MDVAAIGLCFYGPERMRAVYSVGRSSKVKEAAVSGSLYKLLRFSLLNPGPFTGFTTLPLVPRGV